MGSPEGRYGAVTLARQGGLWTPHWIRGKGWNTLGHLRVMRLDTGVAYLVTGLFVTATLIVGAGLL